MRRRLLASVVSLATLVTGCTYELRGRVLETNYDSVQIVPIDDVLLDEGAPITGARLVLTRDPGQLNSADVTSAVAARDGWFTLRVEEFGGGWMEEQWGVRVSRTGFTGTEELITLPFDPKKSALLVTLSRGAARKSAESTSGSSLSDESSRFLQSPGGR